MASTDISTSKLHFGIHTKSPLSSECTRRVLVIESPAVSIVADLLDAFREDAMTAEHVFRGARKGHRAGIGRIVPVIKSDVGGEAVEETFQVHDINLYRVALLERRARQVVGLIVEPVIDVGEIDEGQNAREYRLSNAEGVSKILPLQFW